ncbi:MAG: hypothetical protein KatS3mg012_1103 [Gaiellaceae bacterium]|nr:MAG: hypothetical protein KatS3mg012_1103 [Gaiellaceae bacterium]
MRHASRVNAPRVAVVSFLGGAVSVLPFAQEWFGVGDRAFNWLLFAALVSSVALGFAIHFSGRLRRLVETLAGPPEPRARALVLVAVFAAAGLSAMVAAAALVGTPSS